MASMSSLTVDHSCNPSISLLSERTPSAGSVGRRIGRRPATSVGRASAGAVPARGEDGQEQGQEHDEAGRAAEAMDPVVRGLEMNMRATSTIRYAGTASSVLARAIHLDPSIVPWALTVDLVDGDPEGPAIAGMSSPAAYTGLLRAAVGVTPTGR